jgi:hypothetical protein
MASEPDPSAENSRVPSDDQKPDDISDEEWAAIQEAEADFAAGRYYTQEEVERWLREHQAARRRADGRTGDA